MRWLLIIASIWFNCNLFAQILEDIGSSSGFTTVQNSHLHYGNGMSFFDFDNDGWDDLTLPLNSDSVIFYKNNNGTLQTVGPFIDPIGPIREVLWVDYDNDNDYDLCVTYAEIGIRLYQNDGLFNFSDVTLASNISLAGMNSYGVSFADFDADGFLDFYLSNYSDAASPFDQDNLLYQNNGDGTFTNVTIQSGVGNGTSPSFMGIWYDYNEDDQIDIHLINDRIGTIDAFYQNAGDSTFTDVTLPVGVNVGSDPMGIAISDFDNDGYQDAFISDDGGVLSKLLHNQNGNYFDDIATAAGLDTNIMGWGVLWVDYNNDGFEDLYLASSRLDGTIANEETSLMFLNETQGSFELINDSISGDILCSSYSPVKGDLDNDGFYDIAVLNDNVPSNLLHNSGNENNYIKITPIGTVSNRMAIGSKVKVYTQGLTQYQVVSCGIGLCSQNSQHLIFGVGQNTIVDSVIITFPSGIVVKKYALPVEQSYVIEEKFQVSIDIIPGTTNMTLCQGDSIVLSASNMSNILWNTGSTDSVIIVDIPGSYYYESENSMGDTAYISTQLIIDYEQAPLYQTVINNPDCGLENFGSSTLLFISPPASQFDINWSNGDVGIMMDSVTGGIYTYDILSSNNCTYSGSVSITQTPLFSVQFLTSPVTNTELGTIEFFTFGGTPPFQFELNSIIESAYISDLDSGYYEVLVTDDNGCEVLAPFVIAYESTIGLANLMDDSWNAYSDYGEIWLAGNNFSNVRSIKIMTLMGSIVATESGGEIISSEKWKLSKSLTPGVYLISVEHENGLYFNRLYVD